MSTSKPRSAKAVAITLAPRSWPSWPSLTTSMRGRRPSSRAKASTSCLILRNCLVACVHGSVHPADRVNHRPVAAIDLLERVGDLPDARARTRGVHRQLEQVARLRLPRPASAPSSAASQAAASRPARTVCRRRTWDSRTAVLSMSRISISGSSSRVVLVDADDDLLAAVDARLAQGRRLLDAHLRHARLDRLGHAAELLDFGDELASPRPPGTPSGSPRSRSPPAGPRRG